MIKDCSKLHTRPLLAESASRECPHAGNLQNASQSVNLQSQQLHVQYRDNGSLRDAKSDSKEVQLRLAIWKEPATQHSRLLWQEIRIRDTYAYDKVRAEECLAVDASAE